MSTSCITVKGRDLWLNDIDLSVLLGLVANGSKISGDSNWVQSLRKNWPDVKASFAPGCISTGLEEASDSDGELAKIAIHLKSVLQSVKSNPAALASDSLNSMGIPGVVFSESYPLENIERSIVGIIQLISPRA